ncbi:uncharacterized protein BDR25DRAFT_345087 [Lindgomyces ingoldianus]|uniref:Uncharacterized protein n=1 Tax=Lindgomyces ingoldianus TaxID=673940 RepID=A0ACB6QKA1_9PLEO|nr:uncharacterized protein BDR25DRAFT_345087 [Lindgomyces ingoldianus]KAF2467356.1 hypothetical protein BDR25DRAFT_345087 [Lindgomyces ingoldianus]
MADILTQIQDELDMLLHQMSSVLNVIKDRAPSAPIAGQPLLPSFTEHDAQLQTQTTSASNQTQTTTQQSGSTQATSASTQSRQPFVDDLKELSRDLVLKEQQIELLISRLPGIGTSEKEQMERMKELERQLEEIESERVEAVKEKAAVLDTIEALIGGVGAMR